MQHLWQPLKAADVRHQQHSRKGLPQHLAGTHTKQEAYDEMHVPVFMYTRKALGGLVCEQLGTVPKLRVCLKTAQNAVPAALRGRIHIEV